MRKAFLGSATSEGKQAMRRSKHWTDRHGFVLSAISAGLLAWALMSIWQEGTSCVRNRDCDVNYECIHGECVPTRGRR